MNAIMPRLARLDAPGVIHHVIIRGIERRKIFRNNKDRNDMMDRLSDLLPATNTICYKYCGHSVLMGKRQCPWQDKRYVLSSFGKSLSSGRVNYYAYVKDGKAELERRLSMTQPGVEDAVQRGEHIVK